jgi:hypothetical protein
MCYVIDSRQVLANALRTRGQITVGELNSLAIRIQERIPSVSVDVSHYSLSAALEDYSMMFERQDSITIGRTPSSEKWFEDSYLQVFFVEEIPQDIRMKYLDCFG